MNALDPKWVAKIYDSLTGQDFLGLRAVQANITDYLLPGIITITPRARYYPFYSWILVEYADKQQDEGSLADFLKRREQIFALANLAYAEVTEDEVGVGGLTGWRKLNNHWKAHRETDTIPLSVDDYVQATYGGYDAYVGVMRSLEITQQPDEFLDVLPNGKQLAEAFAEAIKDTTYYSQRIQFDTADTIPRSVLVEYGSKCHLSLLAESADGQPTRDVLFALDARRVLPPVESDQPTRGNMQGTLGLILDMVHQTTDELDVYEFRRSVTYGLCDDYDRYQHAPELKSFVAHWRMFQLREYYVYALYALWTYFLRWLRLNGRQTLRGFRDHLRDAINPAAAASELGVVLPDESADSWSLAAWMNAILDLSDVHGEDFEARCSEFAGRSKLPLSEHLSYQLLNNTDPDTPSIYVGTAWLLLSTLYLRLNGLRDSVTGDAWHWAKAGGARRRSLDLFVSDLTDRIVAGESVLDAWYWLNRDYLIAQHTITALEKWRARNVNTFHFNYEDGVFDWVRDGDTGFSASRFEQAYQMLADLGLYEIDPDSGGSRLTARGQQTLDRILERRDG